MNEQHSETCKNEMSRSSGWFWLLVVSSLALYLCFVSRTVFVFEERLCFTLFDDAMVSMRYARNLVEGHGLIYNPGGERVEGYSNPLWTLWMAAIHFLPVSECRSSLMVMLSGIAILVANLWVVLKVWDYVRLGRRRGPPVMAVALVALCYPLVFWTLRGMEVGLLTLGVNLGVWFAFRLERGTGDLRLWLLSACLASVTLIRDDALLPALLIAAYSVATADRQKRLRYGFVMAASIVTVKAGHFGFRYLYYGDFLPNTYYLKLSGLSTLDRAGRGASTLLNMTFQSLLPVLAGAILYYLEYWRRNLSRCVGFAPLLFLAVFLGQAAYSLFVGGDAWEWMNYANRYVTIALPLILVPTALYVELISASTVDFQQGLIRLGGLLGFSVLLSAVWGLFQQVRFGQGTPGALELVLPALALLSIVLIGGAWALMRWAAARINREDRVEPTGTSAGVVWVSMLFLVAVAVGQPWVRWAGFNAFGLESDIRVARLGLFLKDRTDPRARVAVLYAGATPYFSDRFAVDLLGKNDRHVARLPAVGTFPGHNKMDLGYSLGQLRPDIVVHVRDTGRILLPMLKKLDYRALGGGIYILSDSYLLDPVRLGEQESLEPERPIGTRP